MNIFKKLFYIAAFLVFLVFNIPIPICLDVKSIELKATNLEYYEYRFVQIDGYFSFNLLTESRFRGQIIVSGHNITHNKMLELRLRNHRGTFKGVIEYYKVSESGINRPQRYMFGVMHTRFLFRDTIIVLFEDYITEDGTNVSISSALTTPVIVLNVDTFEDAKQTIDLFE